MKHEVMAAGQKKTSFTTVKDLCEQEVMAAVYFSSSFTMIMALVLRSSEKVISKSPGLKVTLLETQNIITHGEGLVSSSSNLDLGHLKCFLASSTLKSRLEG